MVEYLIQHEVQGRIVYSQVLENEGGVSAVVCPDSCRIIGRLSSRTGVPTKELRAKLEGREKLFFIPSDSAEFTTEQIQAQNERLRNIRLRNIRFW